MTAPELRIGSLCSGYGGLDMAVTEVLGGSVAWHCQYDPEDKHQYAARILEHHWPDVPNHGDITTVNWTEVEPIDVLTAGFPCQDLSYAGRGAGIKEGTRSGLWYSVADAVRALRPRLVVLENVRAIVARRPGLDVVLASLAELGFDAEWLCLPASGIGAAHERWRWFCLAWPAADAESDGRHQGRTQPTGLLRRPDAALGSDTTPADAAHFGHEWSGASRARRNGSAHRSLPPAADPHGHASGHDGELPAGRDAVQQRVRDDAAGRCSDAAADANGSGRRSSEYHVRQGKPHVERRGDFDWGPYTPAIGRWEAAFGHPVPWPVEPGRGGKPRLSPRLSEWLMGAPAGHVTDVPAPPGMRPAGLRNARLKALGNGVVRQQAAYALRLLLDRMGEEVAA